MPKSMNFYRDIVISVLLLAGVMVFMSGEFVISTALFCATSLLSNINFTV